MVKQLEDLQFIMTQDMENTFIEMMLIRQLLKGGDLNKTDESVLENELSDLTALFVLEFRKHNKKQRKEYEDIMNS